MWYGHLLRTVLIHCLWEGKWPSVVIRPRWWHNWLGARGWFQSRGRPKRRSPTHAALRTIGSGLTGFKDSSLLPGGRFVGDFALGHELEGLLFIPTSILITLQAASLLGAAFLDGLCFNQACALLEGWNTMCGFTRQDYRRAFLPCTGVKGLCAFPLVQHLQGGLHFLRRMLPTELFRVGKWENGSIKYMPEKKKIRLGAAVYGEMLRWASGKNRTRRFFFNSKDTMLRILPLIQFPYSNKYSTRTSLKVQFLGRLAASSTLYMYFQLQR